MNHTRIRKAIITAVALSGAAINTAYSIGIFPKIFDPQYDIAIKEVMISAVALQIGWIALLLWVAFKPLERRPILLLTVMPILLGNFLHGAAQFCDGGVSVASIAWNTVFGILYAGLYVGAFMAGREKMDLK